MNAPHNGADGGDAADAGGAQDPSDRLRSGPLADEQAGPRRLATLVAGGARLAMGPYGACVGGLSMRVGVAMPIVLAGRQWVVPVAATSREDLPACDFHLAAGWHPWIF
ncbi:MAG: hypothetical protein QOH56_43 [Pseudonocardiales bacterium]|nr:hypothetical protein [Pseudonocardiales bacterium]